MHHILIKYEKKDNLYTIHIPSTLFYVKETEVPKAVI